MNSYRIHNFFDTSSYSYVDEINCFTDNSPSIQIPAYGTNAGIGGIQGFDNNQLPNLHINNISYDDGTYYIATDSGLVAYNGILYSHINTSNSPLPSDKITFVTTGNNDYCNESGGLYIGTDKGVAIFKNSQWIVLDSTNIPINNFDVTGILPPCFEDETYISTLGSGLIKVFPDGEYEIFNTSNGNLLDDTLFYVRHMFLGMGGDYVITGTSNHGVAYSYLWSQDYFDYDTVYYNNIPITNSKMAVNGNYYEINIVATDTLFFVLTPWGSVKETKPNQQIKWYIQNNNLILDVDEKYFGNGGILLTDILGRTVIKQEVYFDSNKFSVSINTLPAGIYIFRIKSGMQVGTSKIIIPR